MTTQPARHHIRWRRWGVTPLRSYSFPTPSNAHRSYSAYPITSTH